VVTRPGHSDAVTAPACPTTTRLYEDGRVIAENFPAGEAHDRLAEHAGAVLWLELQQPGPADLQAVAAEFRLHPLAVEDAVLDHERPKLDRYADHLFMNVYAVRFSTDGVHPRFEKTEISSFITERALITVRKTPGDTFAFVDRWDADAELGAKGGVAFLVHGLLDAVIDGHYAAVQSIDEAMDGTEDEILEEGGAPRRVRMYGYALRKSLAGLRRAVAPMPEVVGQILRNDRGLVPDGLLPYFRDVEDHARRAEDQVEHLRDRINELLDADLNEQSTALNDITRKLAAWAAIIAVPTALTGYFGQNLPYPGYQHFSGLLASTVLIAASAGGLFLYLKRRGWL
jgi:magnesium transporter